MYAVPVTGVAFPEGTAPLVCKLRKKTANLPGEYIYCWASDWYEVPGEGEENKVPAGTLPPKYNPPFEGTKFAKLGLPSLASPNIGYALARGNDVNPLPEMSSSRTDISAVAPVPIELI